jgi:hypothetical protein
MPAGADACKDYAGVVCQSCLASNNVCYSEKKSWCDIWPAYKWCGTATTTTTTAIAATTTTGQDTTTLTTTMAMSTTTLNIEGLTPGEAALYNPALASYWDLDHCAKASDNHNWSWCWSSMGYECQQEVQVEQTLCASGKVSIGFSHRLSKIDGCIFSYYTQYVCQAPAGSIPSGPDLRRLTDIILV